MTGAATTLVTLWRENRADCKPLAVVLGQAGRGEIPGVGEYKMNYGHAVIDAEMALAAMQASKG